MLVNIGKENSVAKHFLNELRNKETQNNRQLFRINLYRLGQIMAYELSKRLTYIDTQIQTPLANHPSHHLKESPVLITILRAGLPYFEGLLDFFPESDAGFIGAYRIESKEIEIKLDYLATNNLDDKTVCLIDPMLATGKSIIRSIELLEKNGTPKHWHIVSLLAAPEGITYIENHLKKDYTLWTFAVEQKLNQHAYIIPGLGDAGDLSFGEKI
ncbi:MAG: uracil phosphoribosyltransferase [Cyclobacteriaceae bacterium]|jgi:uracil phosphoribosyltransferase|nr:uracil phosphoribosyltransferase [Cytophagales bacterium]MCZ8327832.1 uracil phosphoribosyltransferase [Cyclobacteriaceae bacterium]